MSPQKAQLIAMNFKEDIRMSKKKAVQVALNLQTRLRHTTQKHNSEFERKIQ